MESTKEDTTKKTQSSSYTNPLMAQFMSGDTSVCATFADLKKSDSGLETTHVVLRSKKKMPQFGLGTWLSGASYDRSSGAVNVKEGTEAKDACVHALRLGYRLLDTAQMYKNEHQIGDAIRDSGVDRDSVFVVTKLIPTAHTKTGVIDALKESLKQMKLKYVDLFLIHSPKTGNVREVWSQMLALRDQGLAKSVGVSNFGTKQLEGLQMAGLELPEVNQIELHPWLQQKACRAWMKKHGIAVMGYCPLARCKRLDDLSAIAKAKGKSPAQIAIRWSIQIGAITIPKSSKRSRIVENADVFDWSLTDAEMRSLDALDTGFKASGSVEAMDIPWDLVK